MKTEKKLLPTLLAAMLSALSSSPGHSAEGAEKDHGSAMATPGLEEVIVTARKREERLQDAALAINAFSAQKLRDAQIRDVEDLQALEPALSIGETGFGYLKLTMRGLGVTSDIPNEQGAVAFHVDGTVVSRPEAQGLAFFDLERVEVVKGPQGTFYGRNATGGSVNLITAKPTEEFGGYINVGVGNFELFEVESAINIPVNERIKTRMAFTSINRNGFGINEVTGNDIQDDKRWAFRGHADFQVTEDISFLLTADFARRDDAGSPFAPIGPTFPNATDPQLIAPGVGGFPTGDRRNIANDYDPFTKQETWSINGVLDWQLTEQFFVKNIISYREVDHANLQDLDASAIRQDPRVTGFRPTVASTFFNSEQFTEELQLHHDGNLFGRSLKALAGFYYFDETIDALNRVAVTPTVGTPLVPGGPPGPPWLELLGVADNKAWSVFWHTAYDVTPKITLRVGGRFNEEERKINNDRFVRVGGAIGPQVFQEDFPSDDEKTFRDYTPEAGFDFHWAENILLFYTYSEGFKSGAGLIPQTNSPIINPETIENHELGIKTQWLDDRLTLNANIFSGEIEGLQQQQSFADPGAQGVRNEFTNATSLEISGVEVSVNWLVNDQFRLAGATAYLDAEFGEFITNDPTNPQTVFDPIHSLENVEGNTPRRSPKWRANVRTEYDILMSGGHILTLAAGASYTDKQFFDEFNRDPFTEDAYVIVDASAKYIHPEQPLTVQFWGRNLTDQTRRTSVNPSGIGRVLGEALNQPRTWGITMSYTF